MIKLLTLLFIAGNALIAAASFRPEVVPTSAAGLKFAVVGDWGGTEYDPSGVTQAELNVAAQLGKTASVFEPSFIISVGDNFYDHGVKNVDDTRFQKTWENVWTAPSIVDLKWYVIAGNHDHDGNATAEVAFSSSHPRWHYPSFYYHEVMNVGDGSTVDMVFIDTILLADRESTAEGQAHWKWLEQVLSSSTANWIIVFGHYPVWSIAEHGSTPTLVSKLHGVAAYFCGHDHSLQYLNDGSQVNYIVSGAGHNVDPSQEHNGSVPQGASKFFWPQQSQVTDINKQGGFTTVSISANALIVDYITEQGTKVLSLTQSNPRESHMSTVYESTQ